MESSSSATAPRFTHKVSFFQDFHSVSVTLCHRDYIMIDSFVVYLTVNKTN